MTAIARSRQYDVAVLPHANVEARRARNARCVFVRFVGAIAQVKPAARGRRDRRLDILRLAPLEALKVAIAATIALRVNVDHHHAARQRFGDVGERGLRPPMTDDRRMIAGSDVAFLNPFGVRRPMGAFLASTGKTRRPSLRPGHEVLRYAAGTAIFVHRSFSLPGGIKFGRVASPAGP
jgi:hypothetical protein